MNCTEARLLIHPYIDGELDLVRSLDVEKHIETCAGCAAENRSLASLRSALRSASLTYSAPGSLKKSVRQIASAAKAESYTRRTPWFWQWWAVGATAFAAILLMMRLAGTNDGDLLANEMVSDHVRSLMAGHLTDVVSSDQHTVKPWFNGKLDFSPNVKDFAAQGFPLVGGRLDYLHGREVAALIYQRNKHVINVFVWPQEPGKTNVESLRGYNLVSRDAGGLHYAFVSDLNATELEQLADLIGK
jgi:anti-sigma factor RsiW